MTDHKVFYGTKKIAATPMTRLAYNDFRGWTLPEDEKGDDAGYLVEYLDGISPSNTKEYSGYVSWSPKEVFESAYQPLDGLSFGHALFALKEGHRIARSGWNGKEQFVYRVPADSYPAKTDAAKAAFGEMVPYNAYYALKTVQNTVATWVPSSTDLEATDWQIVDVD